ALPVHVLNLDLRDGSVAAVGAAEARAWAETAFHEVQAVARAAPHPVVRFPDHGPRVYAALQHQVLHEAPDRVVGEGRDDGCPLVEAAPQAAGDIIFTPAFPSGQCACSVNAPFTGVES